MQSVDKIEITQALRGKGEGLAADQFHEKYSISDTSAEDLEVLIQGGLTELYAQAVDTANGLNHLFDHHVVITIHHPVVSETHTFRILEDTHARLQGIIDPEGLTLSADGLR